MAPSGPHRCSQMMVIKVHPTLDLCTVMEKSDAMNCNGNKAELCNFFLPSQGTSGFVGYLKSLEEGSDESGDLSV